MVVLSKLAGAVCAFSAASVSGARLQRMNGSGKDKTPKTERSRGSKELQKLLQPGWTMSEGEVPLSFTHIDNRDHFSTVILTVSSRGQKVANKYGTILSFSVYFSCFFSKLQA